MILERRIKKRNLNQLDILVQDTSNEFLQVFDVVDTLPQGRSSFTINGSEFLKTNTEVLVEILDNANNPIFVNAIFDPEYVTMQGTSRSISVEVYPTTPAGRAVLTIVGELDHEKFIGNQPLTPELLAQLNIETDPIFTGDVSVAKAVAENFFIPPEYQGVYNVKFNKIIQINPKARNNQPIRFYRRPQIQVRELIRTEVKPSASIFLDNVNVSTGSISGKRINPEKTLRLVNPAEITPVRSIISCDAKPAPQGGYTDLVGPNTLQGTIYNRAYPLELTSEDSYGSIIRRSWEFGDTHVTESYQLPDATNPKGVERQTHTFTKAGTYKVKLTVASPTGQYDLDTETVTLSAPSAPTAEFTVAHPTASTAGSTKRTGSMDDDKSRTFKFKDTSTGVDNIVDPLVFGSKFSNLNDTEYSWSFGDGNTANGLGGVSRNPIHTYAQSGSYTVALTVKNNYGAQSDVETKSNHILIKESLPIVDFSVNSGSITQANALGANANAIKGATATFTNSTVYYGSSISYAWTFNSSGSTSTATNPTCIYTGSYDAGKTFDVTLIATDNYGRSVTKTKKNLIGIAPSIPQPNFTANVREFTLTGSFEAKRVEFTDTSVTSSACTYQYDFNGGTTGSRLNSSAHSSTFEAANLSGGIFEAGVSSPLTLGITFENPRAGTRCLKLYNGGSTALKDVYNYGYDYGNSGESSLSDWISQYSLADITQNHLYTIEFWARADEPTTIMSALFGCNVNGHTFGSGPAQGTFAVVPQKVGTSWQKFNWSWRFTDAGCKYLTMRLGADILNPGKAVYFDNVEVYKSTSTSKHPRIDYRTKTDGARGLVKQSVTNAVGTERSIQIPNFINAQFGAPSASFVIDDSTVLTQVPITFNASGSNGFTNISEYRWEWGDGSFDTTPNPVITHKYSSAATYVPKLTILTAEGQSTTINRGNVVVSAPPAPTVSLEFMDGSTTRGETPHEILVKATTTNQVTSSNITFGNGDTANSTRGFTVYDTPGTYTVTATVAGPGGSVSDTLSITVTSPPDPPEPEAVEDPEPEVTKDVVVAQETGTELGSGGGNDPAPPAPYTGGGGGGDPYTGCVLAGTIIKTARGDVPVEQVTTDDLVYSFDFDKDEFAYYKIDNAWSKTQPARVFVETESGKSVECSDTHLFYHPDYKNQEICVKDLNVGDIVYTIDEDENVIQDPIRNITTYDEEVTVYNFNVPDIHSYITNDIISHNREKYESGAPNPFNTPVLRNLASPETDFFEIETDQTGTFFKKEMLGAELTIFPSIAGTDMETLNSSVPADRQFVIKQQPLVTKVRKIGAKGRVIVPDIRGLMVTNRLNANKGVVFSEYQDFGPSSYSMSYQKPVTASFRVINKQSYSKVNLTQLRPYSGDVSKVKIYYKTPGDVGGYKLLADSTVEAPEQLADPTIQFGRLKIGYIPIQQHIDYYWFSRQGVNAGFFEGTDSSTPTAGLTYVNEPYIDTMRISGSNYPYNSVVSTFHKYPMRLVGGTEYAVKFQLAGIKKDKQHTPENAAATGDTSEQAAKVKFYISGSSLKADDGFGHLLGVMELDTFGAVSESFDYVEHNFIAQNNGDGRLQLVVESGEWYLGDLSVKPMRESGFSPDFSSLVVPTPILNQRPTNVEYYAEFYDLNGNASDLMAIGQSAKTFQGSSTIVEGVDNTVSGSLFLGGDSEGSGIEIHGGSSYIRNVGYVGYHSASLETSIDDPTRGKAGFMFFSGSLLTDRTDEYSQGDVGFEIHGGPGVKDGTAGAMRFRTSTGKLEVTGSIVATDGHFSKNFSVGTGSSAIEISSSTHIMKTKSWGHPTSSKGWAISGSGEAYFQEGYIGGWQIKSIDEGASTERAIISGSNITLDAGGAALYMSNKGPGSDSGASFPVLADEYYLDFTPDSSEAITSANYYVSFGPKFKIDKEGTLFASGAKFVGTITASAGLLGGFNIGSASMFGGGTEGIPNFFFSGSAIGSSFNKGNLFISSSGFQVNSSGSIKALSGTIGGWDIGDDTISDLNASGKGIEIKADPSTPIITIKEDSSNKIELYHTTDSNWGLKGTSGGNLVFRLGDTNTIAGWTFTNSTISSNNLVINSAGTLETSTFQSGVKGWRISSADNGSAEFEQVTIRGTLKTAVFEKETVNAVGGQLYVGNSTTITGSSDVGVSDTVIQIANASGFAEGEVITAKKVSATGFGTEYMLIQSVAREDSSSDTNFSGSLTVVRAYGKVADSGSGGSGSLGGTPSASQGYTPGQVLVSTGKINTGYLRLNANPNDEATPYMDIVERTGSGVYDVDLKARLGDLSGLSAAQVGGSPGHGLFTDNAFLTNLVQVGTSGSNHIKINPTSILFRNVAETRAELRGTVWTIGGAHGATDDCVVIDNGEGVTIYDSSNDKLVVDSDGVTITENNQVRAIFGATSVIGSAGAAVTTTSTDDCIRIANGTVSMFQDSNNKAVVDSSGLTITQGGSQVAQFAATTTIGPTTDRVTISSSGLTLRENNADTISIASGVVTIGSSTDKVTINGTSGITIRENNVDTISMVDGVVTIGSSTDQVEINGTSGITIRENNVDTITMSGGEVKVGDVSNEHIHIDGNGLRIYDGGTLHATFAATTTIGPSTDRVTISSSGITIREDNTDVITMSGGDMTIVGGTVTIQSDAAGGGNDERVVIGSGNVAMYANDAKLVDIADGSINIGPAASAGNAVIGNVRLGTGGAFIYGAATDDYVNVKSDGVDVVAAGKTQAAFGATTKIGVDENDSTFVQIDSDSVDIIEDVSGTNTTVATFGATAIIGEVASGKSNVQITSGAINLRNNTTNKMILAANGDLTVKGTTRVAGLGTDNDMGFIIENDGEGDMQMVMSGSNPFIRMGGQHPAGTSRLQIGREQLSNNSQLTWHTGGDGDDGAGLFNNHGDNQKISMGFNSSTTNSAPRENFLVGHKNIFKRFTQFGTSVPGEYIFNVHSTNNNLEINGHTANPAYTLSVNGDIYATGNVTAYSDRRRKKEITTLQNALDRVLKLRGVNYRWRRYEEVAPEDRHLLPHDKHSSHGPHDQTDYETVQMGLIAQEAQDIIPEVILENPENGCLSIDYAHMAGLLVEAIKDLNKKVEEQGKLIKELQK